MTHPWPTMLLGLVGILAALALPFAPTWVDTTTVTWPEPGRSVTSSTAAIVPYRPATLTATVPCSALRAAGADRTVLETGTGPGALTVTGAAVRVDGQTVDVAPVAGVECRATITAGPDGVTVDAPDGRRTELAGRQVPQVFGFRTDLGPAAAAGLSVTAEVTDPFATTPGALKYALVAVQLCAAAGVVALLPRSRRRRRRPRWRPAWWVDVAVVATLAGWAVIGPLAVDDGWASMIARNVASTGSPGNYYRWWNAPETPFAFSQELLAPLTTVSIAPLWLRLPSTLLAAATWFVLSRGVLGATLPVRAATVRVRSLAAVSLLAAWLPFNLGTRPESYVALGVTVAFALALRVRDLRGLGMLALVVAVTVPISPSGVLVAAPIAVCAPRLLSTLRAGAPTRTPLAAIVAALGCLAAVGLTIVFADQTWDGLLVASDWHTFFGPALPWWDEPDRYRYLLGTDQQGSAAKRLPILLAAAMIAVVGLLALPRARRDVVGRAALRTAAVVVAALALFAVSPSKWSYHLGAVAGPVAALLTVGVVLIVRRARTPDRYTNVAALAGTLLLIGAAAVAFDGPNAWWLPVVYDVPWESEPVAPLGFTLGNPLPWLVAVVAVSVTSRRHRLARAPAVTTVIALGAALTLLLGSFAAAPLRRSEGSLARINLHRLTGGGVCGLADDVEVLPDGPVLTASADGGEKLSGFDRGSGYPADASPPDPPGTGTSTYLWGSRVPDDAATGDATSRWFVLPPQPANGGVTVSVAGRTDGGNRLAFQFGRADGTGVTSLGEIVPVDRPAADEDPAHPLWRSLGVDATAFPAGADRVRVSAVDDRTDTLGWLAFTGPRLRSVIGLTAFLADKGPVLVGWPMAFLFPCIRDVPRVTAGVATTPLTVIDSPRTSLIEDRRRDIGGVFATMTVLGTLHEVPSRLVGRPDVDWGSVQVFGGLARDAYRRTVTRELVPGIGGVAHLPPER
ncbi:arabinosyltransferase domain-containing protein [Mycobacterium sp. NPDC006124]|uniref:arabinosyltransferase domain-containing protein n=1 Tax=Mycobacterium sp. NPDC006124 TaxID=3156729 RepID=UPI0033ACB24F